MKGNNFFQKSLLSAAVSTIAGPAVVGPVFADSVVTWDLADVLSGAAAGTDGAISGFAFAPAPAPDGINGNIFGFTNESGCKKASTSPICEPIAFDAGEIGVRVFATGFNFGGSGVFAPNVVNSTGSGSMSATIDIDASGARTVNFTALDFGGIFNNSQFYLAPDDLTNCTGAAGCGAQPGTGGPNTGYNIEQLVPFGGTDFGVVVRYVGTIQQVGPFLGFEANWRIEGTMAVTDAPPAIFKNGADPASVVSGSAYTDAGFVCQDVVDGAITPTFAVSGTPAPDCDLTPAEVTALAPSFTCDVTCTDSNTQSSTDFRTINVVGSDATPPVITLSPAPPQTGRSDSADGKTVDILVGIPYTDGPKSCDDNVDGNIAFGGSTSPDPFFSSTPFPPAVDTSSAKTATISYDCNDTAGNSATQETRTVNVIADTIPPVLTLGGSPVVNVPVGGSFTPNQPPSTCTDTNPIDMSPVDISGNVTFAPATVDTSVPGSTVITYNCSDASGNAATPVTQTVNVVAGQNFNILSLSITDVDGDGIAGCFKFNNLDPVTCDLANRFSSDGSVTGLPGGNATIPGTGTDLDTNGNPIGVRFGSFQDTPLISQGFLFTGFPFVPTTFSPADKTSNPEVALPPKGVITLSGSGGTMLLESLPFGGLYSSAQPNLFFLDPDDGTLSTIVLSDNNDDNGQTRTFNYQATWSHVITPIEDPTGAFINFKSFWRLEGVATVDSSPVSINNPPDISSVTASQASLASTNIVVNADGTVTVTAVASDPDGDQISFDWSLTDSRITPTGGTISSVFTFDPAGLPDDVYPLRVVVTDNNVTNPLSSTAELLLQVVAQAPVLVPGADSDFDGILDTVEGFGDVDNDGLPNFHDFFDGTDPLRNRRNFRDPSFGDVVADQGTLVLGSTAFSAGLSQFSVVEQDIQAHGGPGGTPGANFHDRLNDVEGIGPTGKQIMDFSVQGLARGSTACVVLPQTEPLPTQPIYRKYSPNKGWVDFVVVAGGDSLGSTKRIGGVCPDPTSALYDDNSRCLRDLNDNLPPSCLVAGDDCVRVCIEDGGPNDADQVRNGVVADPGTPSDNGSVPTFVKDDSTFGTSGSCTLAPSTVAPSQRADWWLLGGFLVWLGFSRLRRKRVLH